MSAMASMIRVRNGANAENGCPDPAPCGVFEMAAAPNRVRCEPVAVVPAQLPPTLSSQHTASFAELLQQLGISVAVTTYQAGKLVLLRAHNGTLNTHFRGFNKPMGLAVHGDRLAIGFLGTMCSM